MNEQHSSSIQQITGQVRSMFYLVDEPTTMLVIQADGQLLTAHVSGQLALALRALRRGATICATLFDASECRQIVAFNILASRSL